MDSEGGWVGPPRRRLAALAALTADVLAGVAAREASRESSLRPCAFFLQFRRPLLAIVHSIYVEGAREGGVLHSPFRLRQDARDELALSTLGLTSVCNPRTEYHRGDAWPECCSTSAKRMTPEWRLRGPRPSHDGLLQGVPVRRVGACIEASQSRRWSGACPSFSRKYILRERRYILPELMTA